VLFVAARTLRRNSSRSSPVIIGQLIGSVMVVPESRPAGDDVALISELPTVDRGRREYRNSLRHRALVDVVADGDHLRQRVADQVEHRRSGDDANNNLVDRCLTPASPPGLVDSARDRLGTRTRAASPHRAWRGQEPGVGERQRLRQPAVEKRGALPQRRAAS